MSIVTVKNKFQVVIPRAVRQQLGINLGDVLEAKVELGKLTYAPKTVVAIDRSAIPTAEGEYTPEQRRKIDARLKNGRKGPFYGPFKNGSEIEAFLRTLKTPSSSRKSESKSGR